MNNLSLLFEAVLGKTTLNKEIADLQKKISKTKILIDTDIDISSFIKTKTEIDKQIKSLSKSLSTSLNAEGVKIDSASVEKYISQYSNQLFSELKSATNETQKLGSYVDNVNQKLAKMASNFKESIDVGSIDSKIATLESRFTKYGLTLDETKIKMQGVRDAYSAVANSSNNNEFIANYKLLQAELTKADNIAKQAKIDFDKLKTSANELASETKKISFVAELQNYLSKNSAISKESKNSIKKWISQIKNASNLTKKELDGINLKFKTLDANMRESGKLGYSLGDKYKNAIGSFSTWVSATTIVMTAIGAVKGLISTVSELNKSQVDLQMATGGTVDETNKLLKSYIKMGQQLGATGKEVSTAASDYLRQGKTVAETNELIKDSIVLSKIGNIESAEATTYLTTAMKGYGVAVNDVIGIVDKLSSVDMESATDAGGLAEAMAQTATNADMAGISMDKLLGYIAVVGETTGEAMSSVGNSFSTIFSRMANVKLSRLVDPTTGEDLSNVETSLRNVGIELRENGETFRNFGDVLDDIDSKWKTLDEVNQRAIASSIAGKDHMEDFLVLMNNYDKATEYSTTATNSSGTAMEKLANYEENIEAKTKKLQASLEELAINTLDSSVVKGFFDASNSIVKFADDVGVFNIALVGGFLALSKFSDSGITKLLLSLSNGIKSFALSKIGKEAETAATIQNTTVTEVSVASKNAESLAIDANTASLVANTAAINANAIANGESATAETILNSEKMATTATETMATSATLANEAAQKASAVAMGEATTTTTLLGTAMNLLPLVAVGVGIYGLIKGLDYLITTNKEYTQSLEDSISKSNEKITKYENEISSLTDLQSKLSSAKNDNAELLSITQELNDVIGDTSGLLNHESGAYETANSKIKARISSLKDLIKTEKDANIEKQKEIFSSSTSSNWQGFGEGNLADPLKVGFGIDLEEAVDQIDELNKRRENLISLGAKESSIGIKDLDNKLAKFKEIVNDKVEEAKEIFKDTVESEFSDKTSQGYVYDYINDLIYGKTTDLTKIDEKMNAFEDKIKGFNDLKDKFADTYLKGGNTDAITKEINAFIMSMLLLPGVTSDTIDSMYKDFGNLKAEVSDTAKEAGTLSDAFALKDADNKNTQLGDLNDQLDNAQNSYNTLNAAMEEYNKSGEISLDTLQAIIASGGNYFTNLIDESGVLKTDRQTLVDLTNARLMDMKAQIQQNQLNNIGTIVDEVSANEYLAQSNLNLASSIEEVTKKTLESKVASLTGISEITRQNVLNKALSDYNKVNNLFTNVSKQMYANPNKVLETSSASKSSDSSKDSSKSKSEKEIDFIEDRLDKLDDVISTVETHLDNFVGSSAKNLTIDNLINANDIKKSNLESAIQEYTNLAEEEFSKIPARFQDLAKNGGIAVAEFIGDGNDEVTEAIDNYQKWSDKVTDLNKDLDELSGTLKELQLQKFNNIADDYEKQLDVISSYTEKLNNVIDMQEKQYGTVGKAFYDELISQTNIQIEYLQKEREALSSQMTTALSNGIGIGSDEWDDMRSKLSDIDNEIIECSSSVEDFQDKINELQWNTFEELSNKLSSVGMEIDNILSLLDDDAVYENGKWTNEGITQLGLYAQKMELAEYQIAHYKDAINSLNADYNNGLYSLSEYTEKLSELTDGQWEAIDSYNSAEKAMVELNQTRIDETVEAIEAETDAYEKSIQAKIAELEAQKELDDYKKSLAEKQADAQSLQKQISAMSGDPTANAKRAQLMAQLAEKQSEIDDFVQEHSIETQKSALEKQLENYKTSQDAKIAQLQETLNNIDELVKTSLDTVKNNANVIFTTITDLGTKYGISITDSVTTPWLYGENAIGHYSGILSVQSSAFISQLDSIKNATYANQYQAEQMAIQFINTFGVSSGSLQSELNAVQSGLLNDYSASQILYNSISNLFSANGLDNSGIIGKFTEVSNAINSAANSASAALGNLSGYEYDANKNGQELGKTLAQIQDIMKDVPDSTQDMLDSWAGANTSNSGLYINTSESGLSQKWKIQAYAKGGIVPDDENKLLNHLAQYAGEDAMIAVKRGEGILTPEQTEAFMKMVNYAPQISNLADNVKGLLSQYTNNTNSIANKTSNIFNNDNKVIVNGDVSDKNINKIQGQIDSSINNAFQTQSNYFKDGRSL